MQIQPKKWNSTRNIFTLYGVIFGFLFPVLSTLAETYLRFKNISLSTLIQCHHESPLLWVIDSAPFFLGLFARIAGIKQETAESINIKLNHTNQILKSENLRSSKMEAQLKEMISVYNEDLNSARLIQEYGLPELPIQKECKFSYKFLPLNPVGGDLVSLIKLTEGGISILIGDVVGHGISAALITSLVKVLSNKNCRNFGTQPKLYMENLNKEVIYYLPQDFYLTALYGYLSFQEKSVNFNFSRGGHPYPFLYSSQKKQTEYFEISGSPLGILENLTYNELSIDLFSGDRMFIITDGLIEIRNEKEQLLGHTGLSQIITNSCLENLTLDDTIESILEQIKEFSKNQPPTDDRLILGIEIS